MRRINMKRTPKIELKPLTIDDKIKLNEEYMILTLADQKKGKVYNTQHSMFNEGQTYKMIRFPWKIKGEIETIQVQDRAEFIIENGKYIAKI